MQVHPLKFQLSEWMRSLSDGAPMPFHPLKFQLPLATGGIALMAYNYLQFAVPTTGDVTLGDLWAAQMSAPQFLLNWFLVGLMLVFTVFTLGAAAVYLRQMFKWRRDKVLCEEFLADAPTVVVGGCIPYASLAMTAMVCFAPLAFFCPLMSSNPQTLMLPGLLLYGVLWVGLIRYECIILKKWLTQPFDETKLNFIWLLDAFSFGMMSLMGAGIAATAHNASIASIAACTALFVSILGLLLLAVKLCYLVILQLKAAALPTINVLPSFFIVVPISCLYGFGLHKLAHYLQAHHSMDMKVMLFFTLLNPYVIAVGWALFTVYLLWEYLRNDFPKCDFAFPQWSII